MGSVFNTPVVEQTIRLDTRHGIFHCQDVRRNIQLVDGDTVCITITVCRICEGCQENQIRVIIHEDPTMTS